MHVGSDCLEVTAGSEELDVALQRLPYRRSVWKDLKRIVRKRSPLAIR